MKRLDAKRLGRLAVSVRGLRERKTVLERELAGVNAELSEKEPTLATALGEPALVPPAAID